MFGDVDLACEPLIDRTRTGEKRAADERLAKRCVIRSACDRSSQSRRSRWGRMRQTTRELKREMTPRSLEEFFVTYQADNPVGDEVTRLTLTGSSVGALYRGARRLKGTVVALMGDPCLARSQRLGDLVVPRRPCR